MIKKFIKIQGTGKFFKYDHSSIPADNRTADFEKFNLIYGENGSGKTTLSIILKSLNGDDDLLLKKRSFDMTVDQNIELLTDLTPNPKLTFSEGAWNSHYPNIEIFDIHFINDNIYTGLEIQNTHRKNLFEVILGEQGIRLKGEIQSLKEQIQDGKKSIKGISDKIEREIEGIYKASKYAKLPADPEIDAKIKAKESEIVAAKSFQEIQRKLELSSFPLLKLPFDVTEAISALRQSIDSISEDFLEKVNEHKAHLSMNGREEEWIKQGYEAMTPGVCPFCLQRVDESVEIVEAYKQYFNEEYNALISTLSRINSDLASFNIEAELLQIENRISENHNRIEFWRTHLPNPPALASIKDKQEAIINGFNSLKALFEEKSSNPILAKDSTLLETFVTMIDSFNRLLGGFNSENEGYNSQIKTLKSSVLPDLARLLIELKQLKAIKKKEDEGMNQLCTDLLTLFDEDKGLNENKNIKQQELDEYSTTIFTNYAASINGYLRVFAPYLAIRDLDAKYVGTSIEPMVKYALHIEGNEITLDDSSGNASFKYSLSEGDKSALALSFFLAKLELDENLEHKIIIFDDPVSSFDLNRKSATINKLIALGEKARQLFIFTHNIVFAGEFWKSAEYASGEKLCSKIEYFQNTSCIVKYDIDSETLSTVLKDSREIKKYIDNGCLSDDERRAVARCLRPALESYFHLKFFDVVGPKQWLGDFISKIREATDPNNRFYRLKEHEEVLTAINDYSKRFHHRWNSNSDGEPINNAELKHYCIETLKLIQVI